MSQARKDILNGWKEIAGYISRDIRTVERWEKQRGLPVRRIPGTGRGVVYAHISEVEQWLAGHKADIAEAPEIEAILPAVDLDGDASPTLLADAAGIEDSFPLPAEPVLLAAHTPSLDVAAVTTGTPQTVVTRKPVSRTWLAALLVATACIAVSAVWIQRRHAEASGIAATLPKTAPTGGAREYKHSQVAGVNELYLRGAFALEQRTPESLAQARNVLLAAIAKDPTFAPAYASLGEAYCLLREYGSMPDPEAWSQAEANARKALTLDPQLSDAYAVLGFVDFFWEMKPSAADEEFRTAISLQPGSVLAHHWYGSMLTHQGRLTEALAQLDTAQHLNPSSFAILTQRALAIGLSGHRDEADAMLDDMLKENHDVGDHDSSTAHIVLGILSFQHPADLHRALVEYQRSAELRHDAAAMQRQARLLKAFEAHGPAAMWQLKMQMEQEDHPGTVTYPMVESEAQLGRVDDALRDLRRLLETPHNGAVMLNTDALMDPLRSNPQFTAISGVHAVDLPASAGPAGPPTVQQ